MAAEEASVPTAPVLRIVGSDATPEEVAALVAVFSSLGGVEPGPAPAGSTWSAPHRLVRTTLRTGPGGWRSSGLPQ